MILYNTLTRSKEHFTPFSKERATLYACGPTVYDYAHMGHVRAYLFVDVLARAIRYNGYPLLHVMNITDVGHLTDDADQGEDKIERKALSEKKTVWDIARMYTDDFFATMDSFSILRPDIICKATDHIKDMISLILRIEKNGYAYRISDGIYFDTAKVADYGKLAQLDIEKLKIGARVEPNPEKRNPTDFALWKFSTSDKKRQMEWDSPWGTPANPSGKGFPGWHIECTAMAVKYLGEPIDIHTGGIDHIPVHHTNEIAQAQGAFGRNVVRFWLHNEFMLVDGEKMSKSKGNFYRLKDIADKDIHPAALRYFFLQAHYRSPVNFTWEALRGAQQGIEHLYERITNYKLQIKESKFQNRASELKARYATLFLNAINDDLNTAKGLAVLWDMLRDENLDADDKHALAADFDKTLGLGIADMRPTESAPPPPKIKKLAKERETARAAGDFARSDELRLELEGAGYEVRDTKIGQEIVKK